jgi:hypothetical protein
MLVIHCVSPAALPFELCTSRFLRVRLNVRCSARFVFFLSPGWSLFMTELRQVRPVSACVDITRASAVDTLIFVFFCFFIFA